MKTTSVLVNVSKVLCKNPLKGFNSHRVITHLTQRSAIPQSFPVHGGVPIHCQAVRSARNPATSPFQNRVLLKNIKPCVDFNTVFTKVKSGHNAMQFPREIIWLGGAPGSGKGTNSKLISSLKGIKAETIVMSSLLESGEAKAIKAQGGMVGDNVALEALLLELCKPQYRDGVIVDGFPRTKEQAVYISELNDRLLSMGQETKFSFIMLYIDEASSVARQLTRGECVRQLNAARAAMGLPALEERATDSSESYARKRYGSFIKDLTNVTSLATQFPFSVIDANAPLDIVQSRIVNALGTSCHSHPYSTSIAQNC